MVGQIPIDAVPVRAPGSCVFLFSQKTMSAGHAATPLETPLYVPHTKSHTALKGQYQMHLICESRFIYTHKLTYNE